MKKFILRFHGEKDEEGNELKAVGKSCGLKRMGKEVLVKKGIQLIKDDDECQLEDRRYMQAARFFDAALKQDNRDGDALYHRAYCMARLRKYEEAAIELEKLLEICPDNQDAALMMMHVCSKLGRKCGKNMDVFLSRLNMHEQHAARLVKIYDEMGKMFRKIEDENMARLCFDRMERLKRRQKKNPD